MKIIYCQLQATRTEKIATDAAKRKEANKKAEEKKAAKLLKSEAKISADIVAAEDKKTAAKLAKSDKKAAAKFVRTGSSEVGIQWSRYISNSERLNINVII